jgi:uncharacterized protein (DUF488 family)
MLRGRVSRSPGTLLQHRLNQSNIMPDKSNTIFTIGFTKKPAAVFFQKLRDAGVKRVIDVRLNNVSQLAGFSKKDDLRYFLLEILHVDYVHESLLAPTKEMREEYKKNKSWPDYEKAFLVLIKERQIEEKIDPAMIAGSCLLCSEDRPHHCHRRLVAEYLQGKWGGLNIQHLV